MKYQAEEKNLVVIDPGPKASAVICLHVSGKNISITNKEMLGNYSVIDFLRDQEKSIVIIEMIASYGMPVGKEIFETCVWIGRFIQAFPGGSSTVYRKDIKLHLCGTAKAKDCNIRQALIDRLGAPGTKKNPGVTYGVSKDLWSALAVGVYWIDKNMRRDDYVYAC